MSVRNTVKSIQDIMRQDTGVDGDAQRISQLCWMFFLKIFDDREKELELFPSPFVGETPVPKDQRTCAFSHGRDEDERGWVVRPNVRANPDRGGRRRKAGR